MEEGQNVRKPGGTSKMISAKWYSCRRHWDVNSRGQMKMWLLWGRLWHEVVSSSNAT